MKYKLLFWFRELVNGFQETSWFRSDNEEKALNYVNKGKCISLSVFTNMCYYDYCQEINRWERVLEAYKQKNLELIARGNHREIIEVVKRYPLHQDGAFALVNRGNDDEIMAMLTSKNFVSTSFMYNDKVTEAIVKRGKSNEIAQLHDFRGAGAQALIERGVHEEIMNTKTHIHGRTACKALIARGNHDEIMRHISAFCGNAQSTKLLIDRGNDEEILTLLKQDFCPIGNHDVFGSLLARNKRAELAIIFKNPRAVIANSDLIVNNGYHKQISKMIEAYLSEHAKIPTELSCKIISQALADENFQF